MVARGSRITNHESHWLWRVRSGSEMVMKRHFASHWSSRLDTGAEKMGNASSFPLARAAGIGYTFFVWRKSRRVVRVIASRALMGNRKLSDSETWYCGCPKCCMHFAQLLLYFVIGCFGISSGRWFAAHFL